MTSTIYLVVYMDGNWAGYDPLPPPHKEAVLTPVDVAEVEENAHRAIELMENAVNGKFVFGAHTGVYCRELFYVEPLIDLWRTIVEQGGELALHPHEEVIGMGTLFGNDLHMRSVLTSRYERLIEAGLGAAAFRGGYNAYSAVITPVLEELGIGVDLSCAPGIESDKWGAHWRNSPGSAYYVCSEDPSHFGCQHRPSRVLEIPMGWDGRGYDLTRNYLYNEASALSRLKDVWQAILHHADSTGVSQFVHFLCHLHAMGDDDLRSRCARFLEYAQACGGCVVTASEAREAFALTRSRRCSTLTP